MKILMPEGDENQRFYGNVIVGELFESSRALFLKGENGKAINVRTGKLVEFNDLTTVELAPDYVLTHKSFLKEGVL